MLIVIEGTDGSGKATQANILKKKLEELGHKVTYFDFPQYDGFFGKLIGRYLNNEFGDAVKLDPHLVSLMYASDRLSVKGNIINANNDIIIANRYTTANLAHQGSKIEQSKRKDFFNWLEELEYSQFGLPNPDLVIFLYVPSDYAQNLVDMKNKRDYTNVKRDAHESDKNYLDKTANVYIELSKKDNWHMINCVKDNKLLSIEEISEMVFDIIKINLNN